MIDQTMDSLLQSEVVDINRLRPHPRNYQDHPADQLEHIKESIREHGIYRNVVVAEDYTILAGHGITLAARDLGYTRIPVVRLGVKPDDPRALKVLAGDNEISHLAVMDDRALSEILKEIKELDVIGLLGTGYDEMMLANLVMVTRPAHEIKDINEAAEWVGMPDYEGDMARIQAVVSFRNEQDRDKFWEYLGKPRLSRGLGATWSFFWPNKDMDDYEALKFVTE